jgi:hypothetical protein
MFLIGPMWSAARPANTLFDWLETESYELFGLVLLVAIGLFAGRVTRTSAERLDSAATVPV